MELDSKNLGRLHRVADPREVWISESLDFTPWLAENLDVLADELGMALTLVGTEIRVGQFFLDIQAEDDEGNVVIIENQLERTDHSHLGQCLVYAAGLEAATVIWVSRQFRDESRRAFDWLNERTDQGVQFFGVELGVVQIGDSGPRAPVFDVVSRPNDWAKGVKSTPGATPGRSAITPLNDARQDLFADILDGAIGMRPAIRMPARNNGSWINFASGPFGSWSLAQVNDGRIRAEAYLDTGNQLRNKALHDQFETEREAWNNKVGFELTFERLDEKQACRISRYHDPGDLSEQLGQDDRQDLVRWGVDSIVAMYDAMNQPLRSAAKALKDQPTVVPAGLGSLGPSSADTN